MPYIGNTPADKFLTLAKQSFSTSATTSYTLDSSISSTQDIALFINNVRQSPVDAYTVSGTALTLTSATAGTDEMYCVYLGKTVGTVNPPNDSVGLDQLSATGTPSSSNYLRGDNSWASAGTTINNNADNRVITGSGTANTLEGESNLTYDGTTFQLSQASPIFKVLPTTNGNSGVVEICGRSTDGTPTENRTQIKGTPEGSTANTKMTFHTENASGVNERMRLTSSGVLELGVGSASDDTDMGVAIGKDQNSNKRLTVYGSHVDLSGFAEFQTSNGSGDAPIIHFTDGNNQNCGEITLDASANTVAYSTSSDYRLKENVVAISDGITRVKNLKPYRFNFITKPEQTVDGFFAHEAQTVVPEAVNGTKDAMKTVNHVVVNADGTVEAWDVKESEWTEGKLSGKYANNSTWETSKSVIDRQGIDQSKLVPLLTSALQEAITKIETLETKVTALENK